MIFCNSGSRKFNFMYARVEFLLCRIKIYSENIIELGRIYELYLAKFKNF